MQTAKNTVPKIRNKYSQKGNCAASVPISTFMCLRAGSIYSHHRSAYCILLQENMWTILGLYKIAHRHMNVEIGTEAAEFPEKECINGIFFAVLLIDAIISRLCCVHVSAKSAISVFSAKSDSGLGTSSRPSGPEDEERSRPRSAAAGVTSSADAAPPSVSPIRRIWFSESQLGVATKETNDDPQAIWRLLILILLCVILYKTRLFYYF